jgi:chitinase
MTDLGTLPQFPAHPELGNVSGNSETFGINDTGQVVGSSIGLRGTHAFSYTNGTMTDLGTLAGNQPGTHSIASGVNNAGQVVGFSSIPNSGIPHAFLYSNGTMMDLGTLGERELPALPPPSIAPDR